MAKNYSAGYATRAFSAQLAISAIRMTAISKPSPMHLLRCNEVSQQTVAMGHQLPRQSQAGAAALLPIADTKAKYQRGGSGRVASVIGRCWVRSGVRRSGASWKNSLWPLHAAQERLQSRSIDDAAAQQAPRNLVEYVAVELARSQRRPPDAGLLELILALTGQ